MPRMKSLTAHPPWDWQFLQPETGMSQPIKGSFTSVVQQVMALRKANKYLAEKHGWRTDLKGVEFDVEQQNVDRCLAGGWTDFVQFDAVPTPPAEYDSSKKNERGNVAGVKRVAAGVGVLLEWLGSSGKGVAQELAEKRAAVCVACPKNGKGNLLDYFTGKAAEKIKTQLEIKNDLLMRTSKDKELGTCEACRCHLPLKVHTPLKHIVEHMSHDVRAALDPKCWVTAEEKL